MNYKKFETQLNKLSSFFDATKGDGINEIERDLLKSYVLKLYEHLHAEETEKITKPKKVSKTKTVKAAPAAKTVKTVKKVKEPVEVESVEIIPEPDSEVEVAPAAAKPAPAPPKPKPKAKPAAAPAAKASSTKATAISDDMKELFADFSSKDLGDKLSQMPIKDLTKAFSINEKIFTIKELFAGDSERFRGVLSELNDLPDFEAAKSNLMKGAATEFKWNQTSKLKKARNFIKIIMRRYN